MGIPYTAPPGVRLVKAEHPMPAVIDGGIAPPPAHGTTYARAPEGNGTRRSQVSVQRPIQ